MRNKRKTVDNLIVPEHIRQNKRLTSTFIMYHT